MYVYIHTSLSVLCRLLDSVWKSLTEDLHGHLVVQVWGGSNVKSAVKETIKLIEQTLQVPSPVPVIVLVPVRIDEYPTYDAGTAADLPRKGARAADGPPAEPVREVDGAALLPRKVLSRGQEEIAPAVLPLYLFLSLLSFSL